MKWERYVQRTLKITKQYYSKYYDGHAKVDRQWFNRFHKWSYVLRNRE